MMDVSIIKNVIMYDRLCENNLCILGYCTIVCLSLVSK